MDLRRLRLLASFGLAGSILLYAASFNSKATAQGFGFNAAPGLTGYRQDCLNIDNVNHKRVLKSIVVGIDTAAGSGSGVVIGNRGNVWAALTARHVYSGSTPDEMQVYSPATRKYYKVLSANRITEQDIDIALVRFLSNDAHPIAILNFNLVTNPSRQQRPVGQQWGVVFDGGVGAGVSMPSRAVTVPVLRYTSFDLQERADGNLNGYELLYQASTVPGMSGGPILGYREMNPRNPNEIFGSTLPIGLIAIHGRSEEYISGGRSGMSLAVPIDLAKEYLTNNANELGIPSNYTEIERVLRKQYCS
jgi:hypothetical protein